MRVGAAGNQRGQNYMIGGRGLESNLVAITDDAPRTTPSGLWKALAVFLRRGLLSFALLLLFEMLPSTEVNDGRDRAEYPRQECGPLKADFSNPCNSALLAIMH